MSLSQQQIREFQRTIFSWWKKNRRDLPWRHTHNPYKIMVSEVMLQQTQVSRVLPKYLEFIEAYPTVNALAQAKASDVLKIWKGMGYNRRALYLHKAAKMIADQYCNRFPETEKDLLKLPGLGKYTTRAILVFAYKKDVAMVDTNIRQIITHFFFNDINQPEKTIEEVASRLVPKGKSWEWHQALMDYGAMSRSEWRHPERSPESVEGRSRRAAQPFKDSNRFFRGRMLDLLREKKWKEDKLIAEMVQRHGKDPQFYTKIVEKLLQEGLLSRSPSAIITLPE